MRLTQSFFLIALSAAMILSAANSMAQPNVTPYQPSGWSDKIVVTTTNGSTTETSTFYTTNSLYMDWCVINSGTAAVTTNFPVNVYVDGGAAGTWTLSGLPVNEYEYLTGNSIGSLTVGSHTVEVIAEVGGEADNSYTKTITVAAVTLAAPTPETPANGATGQPAVPFFSWSQVNNATAYRVLVATVSSDLPSSPTATNGGSSIVLNAVSPITNYSPTVTLSPSTTYFWEVHANPGSDDGTWSAVQQFTTQATPAGLTITPTFNSTITSDPQAATIEATIKAAISVYRSDFSDSVTANFTFAEMANGLGENSAETANFSYSSYRAALVTHATTTDDATALAHLPTGTANPVNGNSQVTLKLPLARALGLRSATGGNDATVYLNTSVMNLTSAVTDPSKFSLFAAVSHEMDEALGFGSLLNGQTNGIPPPNAPVQPQDLFRYDASGDRSLTTDLDATAYFSFDGTTDLVQFNQDDTGDFGDWYSGGDTGVIPQIQDAFLLNGENPVLGVELRGLDAIGYTRVVTSSAPGAAQLSAAIVTGGKFQFTLSGTIGAKYTTQSSSNLITWLPISTNTIPATGTVTLTNTFSAAHNLFYRAISP
ncbi:MAG TPA: NF038122 family metalloprotease [Verrucomicrobiae bacterium]|nr:NF038122 family metalloprotease [Verrucomicrobiae bacterium]